MLTPGTDFPLTSTNQRRSSCDCASYLVKTILNLIIIAHETNPSQIKCVISVSNETKLPRATYILQ